MKKIFLLGVVLLVLFSCNTDTSYHTIKIRNTYSLELPDFLKEAKNLNTEASLQYHNPLKELYVIVIDEAKSDSNSFAQLDLEAYKNIMTENLKTTLKNPVFSEEKDTAINGLKAKLFTLTDNSQGLEIFYKFACIESDSHFYQILSWTLSSRKERFTGEMDKILTSFKELNKKSSKI